MVGKCTRADAMTKCGVSYHIFRNGSCVDAGFKFLLGSYTDGCPDPACDVKSIPEQWYQQECTPYTKPPCPHSFGTAGAKAACAGQTCPPRGEVGQACAADAAPCLTNSQPKPCCDPYTDPAAGWTISTTCYEKTPGFNVCRKTGTCQGAGWTCKVIPGTNYPKSALDGLEEGPHSCKPKLEVPVYKENDAQWCEQFCAPMKIVSVIEQFGDVHNGTCPVSGYKQFNYTQQVYLYGYSINVDFYTKTAPDASTLEDPIQV
eukprot:gnl/MRDRNA2_/MRDRNA2_116068_c0_seq1.p1 gnl/MRDRNA2_/MRDRNA2_116068_c0~~gnl/MRDRNA2_/MRDRNA2_116068_c0_seq1.p1  ORF type:complete len:278 (-),score=50.16 gnl/MRDRNA2_/MRDRNA2_116068_c0_seq1:163-942(-)